MAWLSILFVIFLSCQFPSRTAVPWEQKEPHLLYGFYVYADPKIEKKSFLSIKEKAFIRDRLAALYFPTYKGKNNPIYLILYHQKEMHTYPFFKKHPTVRSYFMRSTYAIHIALGTPKKIWRHELTHALLEAVRPRSPRWLHEGLAVFLEQQGPPLLANCSAPKTIKVSTAAAKRAGSHNRDYVLQLFDEKKELGGYRYNELTSLFFYYLWEKKQMLNFLKKYQRKNVEAVDLVTEILRDKEKIKQPLYAFFDWLKAVPFPKEISGC